MSPTALDSNKTYLSRKWIFDDKNASYNVADIDYSAGYKAS